MKITDIKGHVLSVPRAAFKWRRGHPGLGYDIDWEDMAKHTVRVV
jgi:hypothetical protein